MTEENPLPPAADPVMPVTPAPPVDYAAPATGPGLADVLKMNWAATSPFEQKLLIAGVAAAAVLAFSTFLTWLNVFVASVSGISTGTGKLVLLAALASIVATATALAKKLPAPVTPGCRWRACTWASRRGCWC